MNPKSESMLSLLKLPSGCPTCQYPLPNPQDVSPREHASPSRIGALRAHPPRSPWLIHLPSTSSTIASLTPTGSACHASRRRTSPASCTPVVTVLVTPLPSPQEIDSVDGVRSVCLHVANVNADPFESVHPLSSQNPFASRGLSIQLKARF